LKYFLIILAIFLFAVPCVSAQESVREAVIRELAGTVELKEPGSDTWIPATVGHVLKGDTIISTGFRSIAVIAVGNSLITVRPLTRLSITELSRIQDTENIKLNLNTGRIRAEVKPPPGGKTDFSVRSSSATASVRGTVFEFDTLNLSVREGTVDFTGASSGVPVVIDAGRESFTSDSTGRAVPLEDIAGMELSPPLPIASEPSRPPEKFQKTGNTVELTVTAGF